MSAIRGDIAHIPCHTAGPYAPPPLRLDLYLGVQYHPTTAARTDPMAPARVRLP